ncbi:MAG: hypothetical protein M3Q07_24060, partial [Pseudobdellovibrionaceae bacterium]|nr:hypothetical protein [Pseudobdellovibrionaceae bacterium]
MKSRSGLALLCGLYVSLAACGDRDADEQAPETEIETETASPLALQAAVWHAGEAPLSWFVTAGTFETACLKSDATRTSTHFKSRIKFDGLKVSRVTSFYEDRACKSARMVLGSEAFLSKAYREEPDAKTGLSYLVYLADEQTRLIRIEVYLDSFKASQLNRYRICKRYWFSNMLNNVLKLSEAECRAAITSLPKKDREDAAFLMEGIIPHEQAAPLHLVFHPLTNALSVKQGVSLRPGSDIELR